MIYLNERVQNKSAWYDKNHAYYVRAFRTILCFAAITLHIDLMQMLIALKCWMLIKSFVNENKNESWIGYF